LVTFQIAGIIFFSALLLSVIMTPLSARLAEMIGAIDHPDEVRKHHARSIPRLGGIGITLGFMLPTLLLLPFSRELAGVLAGACIIAIIGLLDDILQLRATIKLLAQIAAAGAFVFISGAELTTFGNLFGFGDLDLGLFAPWVNIFCIVGIINAMNLCDGLDGLAAGFAVIAAIFLVFLAVANHDLFCLSLLLALLGGAFGFLRYNTHPAQLFMGDIGSMMLGYGLSIIAVLLVQPALQSDSGGGIAPISIALILALPILDTLVVMTRRILHGKSPFAADRTHMHHRLMALGIPHDQTVMLLYSGMALFGSMALMVQAFPDWAQLGLGLVASFGMLFSLALFERLQRRAYQSFIQPQKLLQTVSVYTIRRMGWLHRNTGTIAGFTLLLIGFAAVAAPAPRSLGSEMLYFVLISVLLLYPWHPDRAHAAVQKGVIYMMVTALFVSIQFHGPEWLHHFLSILAALALLIVIARAASWSAETHGSSSFQVLILLNIAIIPLLVMPLVDGAQVERVALSSLQAVPVAWLLNGYSVHIYQRNRRVTLILIGLLIFVLLKAEMAHGFLIRLFD
jgi:UDP-GlcNAc:undecaprenyl-phosphate GlcNAc-1-phosphate transferase